MDPVEEDLFSIVKALDRHLKAIRAVASESEGAIMLLNETTEAAKKTLTNISRYMPPSILTVYLFSLVIAWIEVLLKISSEIKHSADRN